MKVLLLRDAAGTGAPVALHPQLSIVRTTDPVRRAWLRDVISRLATGGEVAAGGELEAHGIRFDLDRGSLALLGLDRSVDALVASADLPGHDGALAEAMARRTDAVSRHQSLLAELEERRAVLAAAVVERDAAVAALDEVLRGEGAAREAAEAVAAERARLDAEVDRARDEVARADAEWRAAVAARDALLTDRVAVADRLEAARQRRSEVITEATAAAVALEQARAAAEPNPALDAELASARTRLEQAEAELAELDPFADESAVSRALAAFEQRRMELARVDASLGDPNAGRVSEALDRLSGAGDEGAPVVAALALADTWRDLHQQIAALDAGVTDDERRAEERIALARQTVAEADSEFNQPVLTPEQHAKVEAAHNAVLEAQDRAEGRFGGNRSKRKLEDLRAEERRVLERLGFSTYADYLMSASSRGVGSANRAVLDAARGNLAAAEEDLAALPGAADRHRRRVELVQRRDAVAPRIADLLGHEPTGPEAEDELRNLREQGPTDETAMVDLATSLLAAGVHVGPAPYEREDLELLARAYLAEEAHAAAQRDEITQATVALDQAIEVLRDARTRGETDLPELPELPELARPVAPPASAEEEGGAQTVREARWREVEAARAALHEVQAAADRQREQAERIERLEAGLAAATVAEADAGRAVEEAEAAAGPQIEDRLAQASAAVDAAEAELIRARSAEQEAATRAATDAPALSTEPLVAEAEQRRSRAEVALSSAAAAEQATAAQLADAESVLPVAEAAVASASAPAAELDRAALVEDFTWALLQRLAAVRSVGLAGSVPLVLDDPFPALHDDEVGPVLDRLLPVTGAVQIVVLSDREAVARWAAGLAPDRVAVVAA